MINDVLDESIRMRCVFREQLTFLISVDNPPCDARFAMAKAALDAGVSILGRRSACSTPAWMVSAPTCNTTLGAPVPLFQGDTLHNMPALFSRAWAIVVRAGSGRLQRRAGDGLSSQRAVRLRHQQQSRPAGRQSHCGLPGDEIERHIRDFIAQVSAAG